jgi:hypothetical protein
MTAATSGRATARASMRPRTLVCTTDGIWLWPGTPLTERRGAALVPLPMPHLYQHVATLHDEPPGIGHNRPPKDDGVPGRSETESTPAPDNSGAGFDQPFTLPVERPTGEGEVAQWGQHTADKIRDALKNNDTKKLAEIADALAHADWIKDQLDNIIAAEDPPQSLDELIEAAQESGRRFGYDNHHIIEQGPQNKDVSRDVIDARTTLLVFPATSIGRLPTIIGSHGKNVDGRPHGNTSRAKASKSAISSVLASSGNLEFCDDQSSVFGHVR